MSDMRTEDTAENAPAMEEDASDSLAHERGDMDVVNDQQFSSSNPTGEIAEPHVRPHDMQQSIIVASGNMDVARRAAQTAFLAGQEGDDTAVINYLREAVTRASAAAARLRRELEYYLRVRDQAKLIDAIQLVMGEWEPGSVSTAYQAKERLDAWLNDVIQYEVERAEAAAGWDPNP